MVALSLVDMNKWLLANEFEPENLDKRGSNGDTALMKATQLGEVNVARSLIDAGADVNIKNNDGNNALWFACFRDRLDLMALLIEGKIDINNQNDNGATVLMYAASAGKTEIVNALLAAGANSQLKNLDDFLAIDFAANREILRILKNAA